MFIPWNDSRCDGFFNQKWPMLSILPIAMLTPAILVPAAEKRYWFDDFEYSQDTLYFHF